MTDCFFVGKIPPSSTLVFDIELLDIKNGPRSHDSFKEMDVNNDWKLSKEEVLMILYFICCDFIYCTLYFPSLHAFRYFKCVVLLLFLPAHNR